MIEYNNDEKSQGKQTFDNGDIYEGSFKDGLKHGKGKLKTRNDRSYEGDWKNDKPHGFGINTFQMEKFIPADLRMANRWVMGNGHMRMAEPLMEHG